MCAPRRRCAVVAAAPGYPGSPRLGDLVTLPLELHDAVIFPAGLTDGHTSGGRVLAVTGIGDDLETARANAYRTLSDVDFPGMQVRRDIAWRAPGSTLTSYAAAGVDIAEGNRAVTRMRGAVERTHGAEVVRGVGSFGGAFSAKAIASMDDPVLVASTDGVGTKVELAAALGRVRSLGHDIVNHCVGDVLVQAARPLFFLDYIAASRLDADMVAEMVDRHGRGVRGRRLHAARRRDGGDAGRVHTGLVRHRRHAGGRGRAARPAPPRRRRRRRSARGRRLQRPAHQRLLTAAHGVPLAADGRHAGGPRPSARRRPARAAPQLPRCAVRRPRHRPGQGAGPHHRGRSARERPAGAAPRRRRRDRARFVAGAAAVPARARRRAGARRLRAPPHAQHGRRDGGGGVRGRRRRGAGGDRRADVGDRPTGAASGRGPRVSLVPPR